MVCFYKGQQYLEVAMAKMLDGLHVSFTNTTNEELIKPSTIFEFLNFFFKQLRAWQMAIHHGMTTCPLSFKKIQEHIREFFLR